MALEPITAVKLDALTGLALNDGSQESGLFQARVTAMLSEKLARLSIAGQNIDVPVPKPLPVGTTLLLKPEWKDGQLQLIVQDPPKIAAVPTLPSPRSPASFSAIADPLRAALGRIQAMTAEAVLAQAAEPDTAQAGKVGVPSSPQGSGGQVQAGTVSSGVNVPAAPMPTANGGQQAANGGGSSGAAVLPDAPEQSAAQGVPQPPPAPVGRQPAPGATPTAMPAETVLETPLPLDADAAQDGEQAAALARARPDGTSAPRPHAGVALHADRPSAPETEQGSNGAADKSAAIRAHTAADPLADAPRAERLTTVAVEVPIFLGQSQTPLRLQVTRDDQPSAQDDGPTHTSSWVVRFSSDTGQLGMIHAAISLVDGHIGIQLWAERDETANWFRKETGQLRDALVASDLQLDAVRVSHGSPTSDYEARA